VTIKGGRNLVVNTMDRTKENQIFFLDPKSKTIKSVAQKDSSIDIQRAGASNNLQIWTTNSRWFQLFKYVDGNVANIKDNRVLDIAGGKDIDGQNLIIYKKHNGLNQQWDIVYIDELKPELVKGDFDPDFGMFVEREFSIITNMGSGRYIDTVNNNLVIKTRRETKTQKWYYDRISRTIMNSETKKSWDIVNSGRGGAI